MRFREALHTQGHVRLRGSMHFCKAMRRPCTYYPCIGRVMISISLQGANGLTGGGVAEQVCQSLAVETEHPPLTSLFVVDALMRLSCICALLMHSCHSPGIDALLVDRYVPANLCILENLCILSSPCVLGDVYVLKSLLAAHVFIHRIEASIPGLMLCVVHVPMHWTETSMPGLLRIIMPPATLDAELDRGCPGEIRKTEEQVRRREVWSCGGLRREGPSTQNPV